MSTASPVGYVVGEVRTDEFQFVTNPLLAPPRLEYVVVRGVHERLGDQLHTVDVLAQVTSLSVNSRLLAPSMNYNEVEVLLRRLSASPPVVIGRAKVLGYLDEGGAVRLPRGAAMPGAGVEPAPDEMLRRFFSKDVSSGITIGTLINRPAVDVQLNPDGLRRHMAVIAQTGTGKSYAVGVVLEQLLQLGGTVVVFDPNSDYVLMGQSPKRQPTQFADRVDVFRVPSEQQRRIGDDEIGGVRALTVRFSQLEVEEICDLANIAESFTNIRKAVQTAHDQLRRSGNDFTAEDLHDELEALSSYNADASPPAIDHDLSKASGWTSRSVDETRGASPTPKPPTPKPPTADAVAGAGKALKYIEFLARLPIWGFEDVPLEQMLKPMHLSTIDLAAVDRKVADFIVTKIVSEFWKRANRDGGLPRPVFLVLEEAHNFVPAGAGDGQASYWLKRIASEGRKFGIFLVLVTQRPYRVHQDTLSQCGSQVIMRLTNPEDQNAVRRASESISEGLLSDLPGLNIGEAVVLGPLVRVPVMVRVGRRESAEGGSDINIVDRLEAARSEAVTDTYVGERQSERTARGRTTWSEEL